MAVIQVGESDIYTVFVKMSTGGKVNLTVDGKCVYVQMTTTVDGKSKCMYIVYVYLALSEF